jgi:dTDP-4-dehydrorhamnose 3,5-epimerase
MDEVILTPLKCISHPKGDIRHIIKKTDQGYNGFGEVYATSVFKDEIKGWKKHKLMTLNLVVILGTVRFYVYDEEKHHTSIFDIGQNNYQRLTIPSGYWVAFKGLTIKENVILNIANIEHDSNESINVPTESYPLDL